MKIETNYNIGDEVWVQKFSMPIQGKIYAISVHENCGIVFHVETTNGVHRGNFVITLNEDELFPSKEELLNSL